jgi:hypothetical protein
MGELQLQLSFPPAGPTGGAPLAAPAYAAADKNIPLRSRNLMDNWPSKIVVVFSTMVDVRGKPTPASGLAVTRSGMRNY